MAPKCILVMRHGEKTGNAGDRSLSQDGHDRAKKLATYIPNNFGKPDFIFAAADSKESERPRKTVEPLQEATGIRIHDKIADKECPDLATKLLTNQDFSDKRIVVCWHHGQIPKLMHALGAAAGTYPGEWKEDVFDEILLLDYRTCGKPIVTKVKEPF